jgi:hypothetical protein
MLIVALVVAACYGGFGLYLNQAFSTNSAVPSFLAMLMSALLPNPGDLGTNLVKVTVVFLLTVFVIVFGTK